MKELRRQLKELLQQAGATRADLAILLLNRESQEYLWFYVCQNRNLFSPSTACLMISCSLEVRLNNLKINWSSCS